MRRALLCLILWGACGCQARERPQPAEAGPPAPTPTARTAPAVAPTRPELPPLSADQQVAIPEGPVLAGSTPGTAHRDPSSEADGVSLLVPAFSIDRLPYPNNPDQPPLTGVDQAEAQALCEEQGKRLCHELEWERACEGATGQAYAGGARFEVDACRDAPERCASPFGVAALGSRLHEWTHGQLPEGLGHPLRRAVLRGAPTSADAPAHRCSARRGATPDSKTDSIGFRCCSGELPGALDYPSQSQEPLHQPLALDTEQIREALAQVPQLAPLAPSFTPFARGEISRALAKGGRSRGNISTWEFPGASFAWSPTRGETLWVLSGQSGDRSVLALLYPLPDGDVRPASSLVVDEHDAPLAVGYSEQWPDKLLWTTCFGCPGESGYAQLGEDARISLTYH